MPQPVFIASQPTTMPFLLATHEHGRHAINLRPVAYRPPAMSRRVLRLIRASKFRPAGTWPDDDYDVFDGGQHTGRIVWSYAAPRDRPWVWSITCRFPQSPQDRDSATSREAAMAKFKARWTWGG
jgi:hypothetical protein